MPLTHGKRLTPKIGFIGAGSIGGTAALLACMQNLGSVVLYDINEGVAKGKALDIAHSLSIQDTSTQIQGTADPKDLCGCDVVIITAGIARRPGISRNDLLETNAKIMKSCAKIVSECCPEAFCIIVTNPLDVMVWVFAKVSGLPKNKVVGMAGVLDTARYKYFLSQALDCDACQIQALVLGGHGDSMVPLPSATRIAGLSIDHFISTGAITQNEHDDIITRTRMAGGEIVGLLGTGSAYHAPAAAVLQMAKSYLFNERKCLPCASYQQEILGIKADIYIGVPVIISNSGTSPAIIPELTTEEKSALMESLKIVQASVEDTKQYV